MTDEELKPLFDLLKSLGFTKSFHYYYTYSYVLEYNNKYYTLKINSSLTSILFNITNSDLHINIVSLLLDLPETIDIVNHYFKKELRQLKINKLLSE